MSVEAKRNARIELTAGTAGMDRGLADAKRKLRTFEREQTRAAKKAAADEEKAAKKRRALWADHGSRAAGAVKFGVGMALGGDLTSLMSDAVHGVADFERELTRFQIDAQLGGDQVAAFRDRVMSASEATGKSRLEILRGAHAYQILTGDAAGAVKVTSIFAKVANASGASMDDIAAAAASMHNNLHIDPKGFQQAFDVLISMGHKSNIELRQFGGEMNRLLPLIKDFGSSGDMNKLAEMAASLEVAGPGFKGSADEAAAAAEGFQQLLLTMRKGKTAENFESLGVKIWTIDPKSKEHVLRDWTDILGDIKKKIPDKMILQAALGGRGQAYVALQEMVDNYQRLVDLKNEALGSDQVAKDNATYLNSATGRIDRAWNHIKNSIAAAMTPDRIEEFAKIVEKAATAAGWLAEHLNKALSMSISDDDDETESLTATGLYKEGGENKAAAIQHARDIMNPNSSAAKDEAERFVWSADEHDIEAVRRGGASFLKAMGINPDPWFGGGAGKAGKADPAAIKQAIREVAPEIASALAGALRSVGMPVGRAAQSPPVHVKIGAEPVQKAAANSIEHRRGRNH